jgi:RHS repeat-associated protein
VALCSATAQASLTMGEPDLHQAVGLVPPEPAEGGCFYLRARWMDPSTGRFVSEDPYAGNSEDPVTMHRFLYANNSPVMMNDPTGRMSLFEASATVAVVGILASMAQINVGAMLGAGPDKEYLNWNGSMAIAQATVGIPTMGLSWGPSVSLAVVHLKSDRYKGKVATAEYEVVLYGVSGGLAASLTKFELTMRTPYLFGPKPWLFSGVCSWLSATAVLSDNGFGFGRSLTQVTIGFGIGDFSFASIEGIDVGLDAMTGLSYNTGFEVSP